MRILFLVNGLGLGNSTRCHAVIQYLREKGVDIEVITSGNGAWYFRHQPEINAVHETEALYYGQKEGKLSVSKTIGSLNEMWGILRRNAGKIEVVVDRFKPDVAVIDSIYTTTFKKRHVPLIALNNADVVCHEYYKFDDRPAGIKAQFYAIEVMDYLFHKAIPDLVISPTLDPAYTSQKGKFVRVGPIVRKGYVPAVVEKNRFNIVIMLSGSTFASPVVLKRKYSSANISVLGRDAPDGLNIPDNVKYYGKVFDTLPYLANADLVIINGGFSAVSEMFYMKKPMIVVPVPNHAEQWLNARTIKHLGVGEMSDDSSYEDMIMEVIGRVNEFREAYAKLPAPMNGAQEAAQILLNRGHS